MSNGKALGLLGRNGAGKTTTIRVIMDVFHADSGELLLDGKKFTQKEHLIDICQKKEAYIQKDSYRTACIFGEASWYKQIGSD